MTKKVKGPFPSDDFLASPAIHIGRKLKEARLAAGLTLKEVGIRAGLDRTQVGRYEEGVAVPVDRLQGLADILGVSILWFFSDGVVPVDWLEKVGTDQKLGALTWLRVYLNPKVPDSARKSVRDMLAAFG